MPRRSDWLRQLIEGPRRPATMILIHVYSESQRNLHNLEWNVHGERCECRYEIEEKSLNLCYVHHERFASA